MNRELVLSIFVFSLLLFGCTQENNNGKDQPPTKLIVCPDGKTAVQDPASCPKMDAGLLECEKEASSTYGQSPRDSCYYDLAIERKNASICVKIENTLPYGKSKVNCVGELALDASNPELCIELIGSDRNVCYSYYAFETLDPSVCEKISAGTLRDDCYSKLVYDLRDPKMCEKIESRITKDGCYFTIAVNLHKVEYCDQVISSGIVYSIEACYAFIAKYESSPETCNKLTKNSSIENCYYAYAVLYPPQKNVCELIRDTSLKERCIQDTNVTY
ncbi:hypothetical protein HY570_03420 [Candidatus Micrarchaeota archaeon]|nr:hypothetical protein [Candidatus Micrarchaeota archaeon]